MNNDKIFNVDSVLIDEPLLTNVCLWIWTMSYRQVINHLVLKRVTLSLQPVALICVQEHVGCPVPVREKVKEGKAAISSSKSCCWECYKL